MKTVTRTTYHERIFRGTTGEPLMLHVRRLRLERAANRLVYTDQSVTRIAFDAGYETLESFSRAFRDMFGLAPSAFRGERRDLAFAAAPSGVHYRAETEGAPISLTYFPGGTTMEPRFETREPMTIAFVRHVGPYAQCEAAWAALCGWAGPKGLLGPRTLFIGRSYDDPEVTPADRIRYDACISLDREAQPEGLVGVDALPGGEYAVFRHQGSYSKLAEAYARIMGGWLPQSGRELRDEPSLELYLNDPHATPEDELLTNVYVPLA